MLIVALLKLPRTCKRKMQTNQVIEETFLISTQFEACRAIHSVKTEGNCHSAIKIAFVLLLFSTMHTRGRRHFPAAL